MLPQRSRHNVGGRKGPFREQPKGALTPGDSDTRAGLGTGRPQNPVGFLTARATERPGFSGSGHRARRSATTTLPRRLSTVHVERRSIHPTLHSATEGFPCTGSNTASPPDSRRAGQTPATTPKAGKRKERGGQSRSEGCSRGERCRIRFQSPSSRHTLAQAVTPA